MTAFVDTNVFIQHLTGDPPAEARRATRFLELADELLLADLILAETAYVLESFRELGRNQVAKTLRAILAFPSIRVLDVELLQRAVEVYEVHRLDFADAYLVASVERTGIGVIASFDRTIDRVNTVRREEPARTSGGRRFAAADRALEPFWEPLSILSHASHMSHGCTG